MDLEGKDRTVSVEEDWTHPVAHANDETSKDHTHRFSDPIQKTVADLRSELSRLLCVIGVLTERLQAVGDGADPEKGHEHVVELYDEELIRVSTRNLKMETDPVRRCIRLKVED